MGRCERLPGRHGLGRRTRILWQVNVGGDNAIYGLDPTNGEVLDVVSGPEWTGTSQQGLAYDQSSDTFYIGGWNEGIATSPARPGRRRARPSAPAPDDPNISGLAWNPAFQLVWEATNSEFDDIWLIDPDTCETQGWVRIPDRDSTVPGSSSTPSETSGPSRRVR